ncbi:DUF3224 domain-containing protein [Streptomyces sp. TRM66268-LWL]|uniref:DUF3224 domain-containing protein n=1 Tax=Streptomyces polyasparticus TaxID=2767826 RepID=A0ABR7SBT9_9ACTN|nr:DUF3224 domain-containing protein [Streptomyces polyasparticus]MBC9712942.1 DUF3224 domain-containing protein [Streptomyces polyasparticus]
MRATGTFTVKSFVPADVVVPQEVTTAVPTGVATIEKHFEGEITGRSTTLFTAAYDQTSGIGTYVAMESFEGTVGGRSGTFNFAHAATTAGEGDTSRLGEYFTIVPASSTGELSGITGGGGLAIDADGTHRIWFEYEIG